LFCRRKGGPSIQKVRECLEGERVSSVSDSSLGRDRRGLGNHNPMGLRFGWGEKERKNAGGGGRESSC